ncbi:MAG TPA: Ku protein [Caulobacteraceae bacterium]|jgi:DNA end-binding protein Ku
MAGRAYWKGYLKLSLVSCPVKLYPATSAAAGRISFNLLHKDTLNRVQQKYNDPELGEIDRADLVKGYQFEKDRYVVVTPEELESVQVESSKTIDIDGFVEAGEIDPIWLDSPYFMAPDGPIAEETFAVILEAMREAHKAAVARIVLNGRERQVVIQPIEDGFRMTTLRVAKEMRDASTALEPLKAKVPADMLAMAKQIISSKEAEFAPQDFEDRYENALMELVKAKISGGEPVVTKAPERGNVVNLMDALRKSIEQERRPPAPSLGKDAHAGVRKKASGGKAAAAKSAAKPAAPKPAAKATAKAAPKAAAKKKSNAA